MEELDKICEQLIEHCGGEQGCSRFQKRLMLGNGGVLSRLYPLSGNDETHEELGTKVVVRDVSRSGLGLLSWERIEMVPTYTLIIADIKPLKGTLVYSRQEATGQFRYGFRLDEWLTDASKHQLEP